jgi:hypothetical protein
LAFESFWGALKFDVVALAAALDDADEDEACGWFVLIGLLSSGLAFHITLFPLLYVSLAVFSSSQQSSPGQLLRFCHAIRPAHNPFGGTSPFLPKVSRRAAAGFFQAATNHDLRLQPVNQVC